MIYKVEIVKLEHSKTAFQKFGKFEEGSSKFLEMPIFEIFKMNDARKAWVMLRRWGRVHQMRSNTLNDPKLVTPKLSFKVKKR